MISLDNYFDRKNFELISMVIVGGRSWFRMSIHSIVGFFAVSMGLAKEKQNI